MIRVIELLVIALVGVFVALALGGAQTVDSPLRDYYIEHGTREVGAVNLVTAIYLGYRAYDTLGETAVLLLAVAAVMTLVGGKR